jgi:glycine/D-amino acid oxidase-like deaminating enzyme
MDDELILAAMLGIQRYLDSRPESADTLDGIHYSWIASIESKAVTQAALELLQESGVVECRRYGRDTVIWRRVRKTADA